MTIQRVQGPARGNTLTNTIAINLTTVPTKGSTLILVYGSWDATDNVSISSIDQTGVTWTAQRGYTSLTDGHCYQYVWLGQISFTTVAGTSITITLSGLPSHGASAIVCEYDKRLGIDYWTTSPGGNTVSPFPLDNDPHLTKYASELCVGSLILNAANAQSNPTNGYSLLNGDGYSTMSLSYIEKIISSAEAPSCSVTAANASSSGFIETFVVLSNTVALTLTKY